MAFVLATPLREPGASASEAGGSAVSGLSDASTSFLNQLNEANARCDVANAEIANHRDQLGAACAELKM